MLSCLKFRTKGWGGARLLLVGGAFLVSRTLRIEAAAIRGRLQNALFAAVKVELEGITR